MKVPNLHSGKIGHADLPPDEQDQNPADPNPVIAAGPPDQVPEGYQPPKPEPTPPDSEPPDKLPALQDVYNNVSHLDPQKSAEVLSLSKKMSAPEEFIAKNYDEIKKTADAPGTSFFQHMEENYPGTTKFLSDPKNMAPVHDDLPNVTQHEGLVQEFGHAYDYLSGLAEGAGTAARAGYQSSVTGLIARGGLPDTVLPKDAPMYQSVISGLTGLAGDAPAMIAGELAGSSAGAVAGGFAGSAVPGFGTLAGIAVGGAAGGAAGTFALPGAIKTALQEHYEKGDVKDIPDLLNRTYSILKEGTKQGLVGLGTVGTGAFGKYIGGELATKYLTSTAGKFAAETAMPLAAEVAAMTTLGKGVEGETPTAKDFAEGAILVGGLHAVGGINGHIKDLVEASKTQKAKDFYTALGDTAEASKLRERMPEAHKEYIDQITKDGPVANIYVPIKAAEEYFQSKNLNAEAVMDQLGARDAYDEAKQTGGDIKIPLSTWTDKVVGTEHFKALANDVKFSPDDLTVNELKAKVEETKAQTTQAESDATAADNESQHTSDTEEIKRQVTEQLEAAGQDKQEAKINAELIAARYRARAEASGRGESPLDLMNFDVQKGEAADGTYNQRNDRPFQTDVPYPNDVHITDVTEPLMSPKEAREHFRNNIQGRSVNNGHTGWQIDFSKEGRQKAAKTIGSEANRYAYTHIDQLMERAIYSRTELNKSGDDTGIKATHVFYAPFRFGNKEAIASIRVNETNEGQKFYDKFAIEKETAAPEHHDQTRAQAAISRTQSIDDFIRDVKTLQTKDPFFQPGEQNIGPRGSITFQDQGPAIIKLFQGKDKSTFAHEAFHMFFDELIKDATRRDAPKQLVDDLNTVLQHVGLDHLTADQGEHAIRAFIKTEHHELMARTGEAYLMEGKAPSDALRSVFSKFKNWLMKIYGTARNLGVEISPEIRGVMDRMLATRVEIEQAAKRIGYAEAETAHLPPEIQAKIQGLQEKARAQAEDILLKEQMPEMEKAHQDFLTAERARLAEAAKKEVSALPLFEAVNSIRQEPGGKKSPVALAEKFLTGKLKVDQAAHFETLAELYNFNNGHDLANQVIHAETNDVFNKEVQARVEAGMAPHADLRSKAEFKDAALKAIHNDRSTELLALETQALESMIHDKLVRGEVSKRKRLEASIEAKAARDQAKEILSAKPIKDSTQFRTYVTAERNAAIKVSKALAKGDFEAAAEAKRQQMLNHAIASEAMKNKTEVNKAMNYLTQFADRGRDLKNMPYGFISQVDQLLSRYGLREKGADDLKTMTAIAEKMAAEGASPSDIGNATGLKQDADSWVPESLEDLIDRVNQDYTALSVPDSVLSGRDKNFKDLTLKELRDVKEAVQSVVESGRKYDRFLSGFEHVSIKQAASELRLSIEQKVGQSYSETGKIGSANDKVINGKIKGLFRALDSVFIPNMVNMLTLARYLDRGKEGPAQDYIYRPLKQAEDRKFARYQEMTKHLNDLFGKFYTPKELGEYKNKDSAVYFPDIDRKLTKEQILSLALNWGNEGNRDRIRRGYNLNDSQVKGILNTLEKKDWDFAQGVWDHINTYWPDISALEMKINGVEPKSVEPSSVETRHGTYAGGYYPIAYDFEKSSDAYKTAEQKNELYRQFSTAKAQTDSGHAEARTTTFKRPVRLSLDVLFNHLENVVHDLEFRAPVIDVSRFLNQPDVKQSIQGAIGVRGYKAIGDWLKASASDQGENLNIGDKIFQWLRFSSTLSTLGFNLRAVFLHLPGNALNSASEIGWGKTISAVTEFIANPTDLQDSVFEKSERMRQRLTIRDRDIMDISKKWGGDNALLPHFAFSLIHAADHAISVPLWNEAYKAALDEHGETKARDIADETVTRTLGSGSPVDRIAAMRGGGLKKILTMFYSFMSVMFNRAWLDGKIAGLEFNQGNAGQGAAIMAKAAVYSWILPAVLESVVKEAFHNSQKNSDEDRLKRIAGNFIELPFAYMLIARDIVPPLVHAAMGEQGDYKMSPVEQGFNNLILPAGKAINIAFSERKHFDQKFAEQAAKGVSQLLGVPQQANSWAFNLLDYSQDKGEASWKDFLARRTKK